jgi:uncharacterized protein YbjT (DUF2867 family)
MKRVLVTGATGGLGRELVRRRGGYAVRATTHRPLPDSTAGIEWVRADFATGDGLGAAVDGADVIVHAASSPFRDTQRVDVEGTRQLLAHARAAGVAHVIYISIVGIDSIPYAYYRHKLAAEGLVRDAGVPWSIVRATQFHTLLDGWLGVLDRSPLFLVPSKLRFQPIDPGETADRLIELVAAGPSGRVPDIGGPEVLTLGDIACEWLAARGERRRMLPAPLPGGFARALRHGRNTCPDARYGSVTWDQWLRTRYAQRAAAATS